MSQSLAPVSGKGMNMSTGHHLTHTHSNPQTHTVTHQPSNQESTNTHVHMHVHTFYLHTKLPLTSTSHTLTFSLLHTHTQTHMQGLSQFQRGWWGGIYSGRRLIESEVGPSCRSIGLPPTWLRDDKLSTSVSTSSLNTHTKTVMAVNDLHTRACLQYLHTYSMKAYINT